MGFEKVDCNHAVVLEPWRLPDAMSYHPSSPHSKHKFDFFSPDFRPLPMIRNVSGCRKCCLALGYMENKLEPDFIVPCDSTSRKYPTKDYSSITAITAPEVPERPSKYTPPPLYTSTPPFHPRVGSYTCAMITGGRRNGEKTRLCFSFPWSRAGLGPFLGLCGRGRLAPSPLRNRPGPPPARDGRAQAGDPERP